MKPPDESVCILVVDEGAANRALIREALAQLDNPTLAEVSDPAHLQAEHVAGTYALVVTAAPPDRQKSLRLYEQIGRRWPDVPLVVIAGDVEPDAAAAALARGVREIVSPSGDVTTRLALHLEASRLRHQLRPDKAGQERTPTFYKALGEALEAMQAAPDRRAAFDALASALEAFNLASLVIEIHPDQTFTVAHISISERLRRAIRRVSGMDIITQTGRVERMASLHEVLAGRHALYTDDVVSVMAEWLGFAGARPIASRVRAVTGLSEMIAAPLLVGDEVRGMLVVLGTGNLTPDDLPFVTVLAAQLAARWQALLASQDSASPADLLRLAAQINRESASSLDFEPLMHRVLRRVCAALPCDFATVALIEGDYAVCRFESYKSETYQPPHEGGPLRLRVGEEGIIGHVAATGETLLADDVRREPHYLQAPDRPRVRSELAVPLRHAGETVGVLDVEANTLAAFNREHAALLEVVAGQLAALVVSAGQRAEIDNLVQEIDTLAATSQALSPTLPLHERLARITHQARQALGAEDAALHLLEEDGSSLTAAVTPADSSLTEAVARLAEEVALSSRDEAVPTASETVGELCLLSAPLVTESGPLGAMTLVRLAGRPFGEADLRRLTAFANQAAMAVSFARLHEQNERQKQLLETLNHVSRVVSSSLDLDEVLGTILNALQELIACTSISLLLFEGGGLSIAISRGTSSGELAALRDVNWLQLPTVRHLMARRRPLVVPDTTQDERWRRLPGTEYVKSWIGIPLLSRGNLLGILNINSDQPGCYRPADGTRIMAFANQIATALDNALLFRQAERRQMEARTLYEITHTMVSGGDMDEIAGRVLVKINQIIPYDVGALLRVLEQAPDEPFHVRLHAPQPIDEGLSALARKHIIQSYQALSANLVSRRAAQRDPRAALTNAEDERLPSLLSVPLLLGDRLLGMIELSSTSPGAYNEDNLRVLVTIANSLATTLESAALLEALQARARELEKANLLRDEMVQNVSHEMRNPLTFIRGYVDLLADGELGPLNEEQASSLEIISNKTEVLTRLIDDIVTLNRMTAEALRRTPHDVSTLVREALLGVEGSASSRGLSLRAELPEAPQVALVDPYRLTQVIDNLLSNSLKFSRAGGTITARVIDLGERVRVEIEDEGLGIPLEAQPYVFDRFFRGSGSSTSDYPGMGLGLAISKEIVDAHGGDIGFSSVPGQGSTFYVELDKHQPAKPD